MKNDFWEVPPRGKQPFYPWKHLTGCLFLLLFSTRSSPIIIKIILHRLMNFFVPELKVCRLYKAGSGMPLQLLLRSSFQVEKCLGGDKIPNNIWIIKSKARADCILFYVRVEKMKPSALKEGKKTRRDIKVYLPSLLDLLKDVCAATGEIALPAGKKRTKRREESIWKEFVELSYAVNS